MATLQEKSARLEEATRRINNFVAGGGNPKSPDAVPLGMELIEAFDAVAKEFGHQILMPIKRQEDFIHPDATA